MQFFLFYDVIITRFCSIEAIEIKIIGILNNFTENTNIEICIIVFEYYSMFVNGKNLKIYPKSSIIKCMKETWAELSQRDAKESKPCLERHFLRMSMNIN